jgi:hypothetical protein
LSNDKAPAPSVSAAKNARYVISGEQVYNPSKRRWVSSDVTADVSFGFGSATVKGPMKWQLEALADK